MAPYALLSVCLTTYPESRVKPFYFFIYLFKQIQMQGVSN